MPSLEEDQDIFGDSGLEAKATEEANADSLFDDESDLSDLSGSKRICRRPL